MVLLPESNFAKKLKDQAAQLDNNLSTLDEILRLCSNPSMKEDELLKQAGPMIQKLAKDHPHVAKEIQEVLISGDSTQVKAFFDEEIQRRNRS